MSEAHSLAQLDQTIQYNAFNFFAVSQGEIGVFLSLEELCAHHQLLTSKGLLRRITTELIVLFLSQVAFILAAIFSLGSGRTITSEESPRNTIERPEISSFDASSESTTKVAVAADNVAAPPNQTTTRRERSVGTPEPSCLLGYKMKLLPNRVKVRVAVCKNEASSGNCNGAKQKYGKRACEPHYEKKNIQGGIFRIATYCKCKVQ